MNKPCRRKNGALAAAIATSGHTSQAIAKLTGLTGNTISRILNYRQAPTPETAKKIAKALDSTPRALGLCNIQWEAGVYGEASAYGPRLR